jgi:hypothetical protein
MSRGASLHDIYYPSVGPSEPPPEPVPVHAPELPKHPPLPKHFAIKVRGSYFTDGSSYAWSPLVIQAKTWTDRTIPDGIVERWKKAKDVNDPATLNGVVLNIAEVVEIDRVPVSDLWSHFE